MAETLYRKYRPQTFADLVGQTAISQTLLHQLANDALGHAYLFTGPRGVGKTTTARLLAKAANCRKRKKDGEPCNTCESCTEIVEGRSLDVVEMDAASHTGVDHVREHIIEAIRFTPHRDPYKVFIIDEVHMLSTPAFNALLKTLEEPPAHALFVLATTEVHKLPETIISRTQRFNFRRIPLVELVDRLAELCKKEEVSVDRDVLEEVARLAEGSQRDAENVLAQVLSVGGKKIGMKEASLVLPTRQLNESVELLEYIAKGDASGAIQMITRFVEEGGDPRRLAEEVVYYGRHLMFASLGEATVLEIAWPENMQDRGCALAKMFAPSAWSHVLNLFSEAVVRESAILSLPLEMAAVLLAAPISLRVKESPLPTEKTEEHQEIEETSKKKDEMPAVALEVIQNQWNEIFAKVTEAHASLGFLLKSATPMAVEGDTLRMGFQYKFHADTLNAPRNREKLESVLARLFSAPLRVHGEYVHAKTDEIVDELTEEFGGGQIS